MDTKELGNLGERLACEYLVGKGYNILGRNYKVKFGEIDIIARRKFKLLGKNDNTIHFVEVKTIIGSDGPDSQAIADPRPLRGRGFFPEQRVDYKKQRKLRQLCLIWLVKNKFAQNTPYQIDVLGVTISLVNQGADFHYFPNAIGDSYR